MIGLMGLEVIAALGLMVLVAVSDTGRVLTRQEARRRLAPALDGERDRADTLCLGFRVWVGARLALLVVLVGGALLVRVGPALVVIAALAGVVGVPWMLEPLLMYRRVQAAADLLRWVRAVLGGLRRTNVDDAIRQASASPPRSIARAVTPLHRAVSVHDALIAAARASRSAFVEDVLVVLLAGRTRSIDEMAQQLEQEVMPTLGEEIDLEDKRREAIGQQRATAAVMAVASAVFVALFAAMPKLHEFLASGQGQVTLILCAALYCALVALAGALLREQGEVRWDVAQAGVVLERLGRG